MQAGGSGTEESPCPRWSKRRRLYPSEVSVGVTRDQSEISDRRQLEKMSQGEAGVTVTETACKLRGVCGIGIEYYDMTFIQL